METTSIKSPKILDGKSLSEKIKVELTAEVEKFKSAGGKTPHLAAILVGHDGASETYVASKVKTCQQIGFKSSLFKHDETINEKELLNNIKRLNDDKDVDGILVQLPLPAHISAQKVTEAILPEKDVDGFHPVNVGRMAKNLPAYIAATPYGILQLIKYYNIETESKHCAVVGRSDIVGFPMSILMARKTYPGNCTVTLCHSKTNNIPEITRSADILIVALGKPEFITASMVKNGAVVIDVGITRVADTTAKSGYRLKGDVKFNEVAPKCSFITPVPGGVGPMTIVGLLQNTLAAAKKEIY